MAGSFSYSPPRMAIPPVLPMLEGDGEKVLDPEMLKTDVERLIAAEEELKTHELDPSDGATQIADAAAFDALSHLDDVPGALGVREVKFLIVGVDTPEPTVYFLNTKNQKYHFWFARDVLGVQLSNSEFNAVTYFTANRRFLAGTLIAHDSFRWPDGRKGLIALEFWPTDKVTANFAIMAYRRVLAAMPFAGDTLVFHPSGANQEDLYEEERAQYDASRIAIVRTNEIFDSVDYSPLNLGVGFGRMRVIDSASLQPPSIRDVVIFRSLPNDLSHVAGVLSEEPQTPLSHVNLRARQNDTPNAFLRNASSHPQIVPHLDELVRFEVKPEGIDLRRATMEELEAHLEQQRPPHTQYPPADLTREEIVDLDDAGHGDLEIIGAKAANLAELRKILRPELVPSGVGVPFHFYHAFMTHNGFFEAIRTMLAEERFRHDDVYRMEQLADLRDRIEQGETPARLKDALGGMHARFPEGMSLRCRSSTNNEDLVGFNGAGLYDSFTHRKKEGHIEKSIRQVWASLWNFRAFEERDFYRIDHFTTAMGVLVHPNFKDEKVNGVALTKNIYFPDFSGFYVNAQVGEALVTNPDPNDVSEEFLIMADANPASSEKYEQIRIRRSNLVAPGQSVMTKQHLDELIEQMEIIQRHFKQVYQAQGDPAFAMDLEFKVASNDALSIKQARPWVD